MRMIFRAVLSPVVEMAAIAAQTLHAFLALIFPRAQTKEDEPS